MAIMYLVAMLLFQTLHLWYFTATHLVVAKLCSNTFSGGDVYNNTFSGNVYNNPFSGNVYSNTFSGDVYNNTFSGRC
jgi:hypothetical protein